MSGKFLLAAAWLIVLAAAALLRFNGLADRPVHADEATGARILAFQLEGETYSFNPRHFHGPTLSAIAYPLTRLRGENDWASLEILTLRGSVAVGGVLLVLTPLLWRSLIGSWAALAAGALMASSPLLVFYSRVYIHETWLSLFGMLACAGIYHLILKPTPARSFVTGGAIGLMFATKITVAISLLSWGLAAGCLLALGWRFNRRSHLKSLSHYGKALAFTALGALTVSALFYTNFLQAPNGLLDPLRSFFIYEPVAGHEKPFSTYAWQLLWPKQTGSIWWTEGAVLLLAVGALWTCHRNPVTSKVVLFVGISAVIHFFIYSAIPYKTPWLMLLPWAHLCLLAGCLLPQRMNFTKPAQLPLLVLMLILGLGYQTKQSLHITGRLENSPHNPYNYVPTSRNVGELAHWLQQLQAEQPFDRIAVVGQYYWPLPWYLRGLDTPIAYWPEPTTDLTPYPVVLSMPDQQRAVRDQLANSHIELPRSLRANVPLWLFVNKERWDLWLNSDDD
jgi:uncharacterized protein (TIGR03663 family)